MADVFHDGLAVTEAIDKACEHIAEAARLSGDFALEVAECARLIKGYGDTHKRGSANYRLIESRIIEPALADATIAQNEQSRVIETFLTNPSTDEVDVAVQNVSLSQMTTAPFKAAVTFQKVYYTPGTRHERARETYVAQIDFVMRDHVPNEFIRVNPLGLQVAYFRVDQAFEESSR